MSPSAPMPKMAWVAINGLNAWVMVLSGELSMTSVLEEPEPDGVVEVLDEHAPAPAARRAAAVTATSFLGPSNLEVISVSCRRTVESPRFLRWRASSSCPTPLRLREEARRGGIEAPAGGRPHRGHALQRRILRAAAVFGQRAPGGERAALRRRGGAGGLAPPAAPPRAPPG